MLFLGSDMSGLELRALSHYLAPLDGGKYMQQVLEGDVHWMNAQAMGLASTPRDKHNPIHTIIRENGAKTFIYAYIYGCGDDKAGEIIFNCLSKVRREGGEELYQEFFGKGIPGEAGLKRVGRKVRNGFLTSIDGFADLKAKLALQVEKHGWVPGLDGRRIPVRSEHSALNFMIQSCGAILCKRWMTDAFDELVRRFGYDTAVWALVLWVHDELQFIVREDIANEVEEILKRCAEAAGEPYGFRGPLAADVKKGQSWRDTH